MKRSDLTVGEMYLDSKGRYVIVLDLSGWRSRRGMWANGFVQDSASRGVAVAYCEAHRFDRGFIETWHSAILQLQNIALSTSREQVRRERAESETRSSVVRQIVAAASR